MKISESILNLSKLHKDMYPSLSSIPIGWRKEKEEEEDEGGNYFSTIHFK